MRWKPSPGGIACAVTAPWEPSGGRVDGRDRHAGDRPGARGSFPVCGVGPGGAVVFDRARSRARLAALVADQAACGAAMGACAASHPWGRVARSRGHEVRRVPAACVRPFVEASEERACRRGSHRPVRPVRPMRPMRPMRPARPCVRPCASSPSGAPRRRAARWRAARPCLAPRRARPIDASRGHRAEFGLGARPRGAEGPGGFEAPAERARRRGRRRSRRPARPRPREGCDPPRADRAPRAGDRAARGRAGGGVEDARGPPRPPETPRGPCTPPGVGPLAAGAAGAVAAFAPELDTLDGGRNLAAPRGTRARRGRSASCRGSARRVAGRG